jgi:hypothetical protein
MDEVLAKLLGAELIGRTVEMFAELADAGVVGLLSARTDRQELQVVGEGIKDCVREGLFLCMVVWNERCSVLVSGAARMPSGRRTRWRSAGRDEITK